MYNDQSFSYSWHGLQIKEPMNLQGVKLKHWNENNDSNRKARKGFSFIRITIDQRVKRSQFSSVQSLSRVWLFATPWITAHQASLSITNFRSSPRLTSIESAMPSSHLILCRPLLLLPPIPPSIRVFSNESTLRMRWPKYWSFSFSISPSNEHPGLIYFSPKRSQLQTKSRE